MDFKTKAKCYRVIHRLDQIARELGIDDTNTKVLNNDIEIKGNEVVFDCELGKNTHIYTTFPVKYLDMTYEELRTEYSNKMNYNI